MKKIFIHIYLIISLLIIFSLKISAQIDSTLNLCKKDMTLPFVTDGQTYKALLNGDEAAEFYATFYGESTYRIVGYSGNTEGNLIFSIYDKERNLLFTNLDFKNAPYWDFEFENSMDCIIEAKLDLKNKNSGFAVLLIGFKQ